MSGIPGRSLKIYLTVSCCSKRLFHSLLKNRKMPFYAVAKGRSTGIYNSWAECEAQVKGFSGAKFKKFDTASSANDFVMTGNYNSNAGSSSASTSYQSHNYHSTASNNLKRSHPAPDPESSEDDLDDIIKKQMDDVEKRVNSLSKGIDRITKNASKQTKQIILIDLPKPKKSKHINNNTNFEEDNDGFVQVYTDGACTSNGKLGARAGLGVYWGNDHHLNRSEPVSGRATNNCGEIQAATLAIKTALKSGVKKLAINTDSQFLIKSATQWIPGWKQRGWMLASGTPVKNVADFKELDSVKNKLEIKWNYVKAHNGLHGNEMADKLAKEGAARYNK